jgi:hypothetical protein
LHHIEDTERRFTLSWMLAQEPREHRSLSWCDWIAVSVQQSHKPVGSDLQRAYHKGGGGASSDAEGTSLRAAISLDDALHHNRQAWERIEEAYALAARAAHLAVLLQSAGQQLNSVGNLWSAADQARLVKEARAARESYRRMQQRRDALRRAYASTWRDLRHLQRGWSAQEWQRYQALIEERIEREPLDDGQAHSEQSITRRVLVASTTPELERALTRVVRSWWARLIDRVRQHA